MFLSRFCRGGRIPKKKLEDRFQAFFAGQRALLIEDSITVSNSAATARICKRTRRKDPRRKSSDGSNKSSSHRSCNCSSREDDGEELATLQNSLRRAKMQAQVPPVEKRIADCSQFIERAKKRAEAAADALRKAEEFKRVCDDEVVMAERRLEALRREVATADVGQSNRPDGSVVKRCRREDFVPHCDEEMQEWMHGRHADLQAAVEGGHLQEVARISQLMTTAAQEWQELINRQSVVPPSAVANFVGSMVP